MHDEFRISWASSSAFCWAYNSSALAWADRSALRSASSLSKFLAQQMASSRCSRIKAIYCSVSSLFLTSALLLAVPPAGGLRAPGDDQHVRGFGRTVSVGGDLARLGGGVPGGVSHSNNSVTRALSPSVGVEILSAWVGV